MMVLLGGLLALQAATIPGLVQQAPASWPACTAHRERPADSRLTDSLARRFAPVLSFAPGEGLFPTLPFFTAFDGDGTNGDSEKADFEDPWEIAPYLRRPNTQVPVDTSTPLTSLPVSWKELLKAYHPESGPGRSQGRTGYSIDYALHRVVVLYRVCSLSRDQNKNLERFLRSDEQAFERFQELRTFDSILKKPTKSVAGFDVIQYFLYYLADRGLQGHPNDIELVSVFLPHRADLREKFRIVVGSGHSPRTPNNVLVLSAFHRGESKLQDTLHVLVELGGHSSAPDLRPIGKFTPGLDANWHAYDLWGTRDAQAAGGIGYLGQYRQAMTFDRGFGSDGIYVFPPRYTADSARDEVRDIKGLTEEVDHPADSARDQRRPASIEPDSVRPGTASAHIYRLLPMHLLIHLDSALNQPNRAEVASAVTRLQEGLCPARRNGRCDHPDPVTWSSRRFESLDTTVQDQAIRAMRRWKLGMNRDTAYIPYEPRNQNRPGLPRVVEFLSQRVAEPVAPGTHRPWEHASFRGKCDGGKGCDGKSNPTEVLKAHLFRPNTYTVEKDGWWNLLLYGVSGAQGEGYEVYTGIVVPAFRSNAIPVRFGGFVELHAGINCHWNKCKAASFTLGALYEAHRNAIVSWYAAGKWVPSRDRVTDDPDAGEFALSGGVSILPVIEENIFGPYNIVRIRGGLRVDPFKGKDVLSRVRWELNLAFRQ
jgi:hypothetical protein